MVEIIGREDYAVNPADYILLEGQPGKDGYPDLHICKYRLGLDDAVRNAGEELELNLENTEQEKNGRGYVGNINRKQALKLNLMLGGRTLNTRTGKDFFKLLFSRQVFDGNGERILKKELSQIAEEIGMKKKISHRAEWFEDYFIERDGDLILNKNYVLQEGVLVPEYSCVLTSCLMKNKIPGISFKSWLKKSTAQGYPKKNVKSGKLWYWHPKKERGVEFCVVPDGAYLDCGGPPQFLSRGLGVRHVREAPQK